MTLMTRNIILKSKITKHNREEYLDAHPTWFSDFMNLRSKYSNPVKRI